MYNPNARLDASGMPMMPLPGSKKPPIITPSIPIPPPRPTRVTMSPQTDTFTLPIKRISSEPDLLPWIQSEAFVRLLGFLQNCNMAVLKKKVADVKDQEGDSIIITKLLSIIKTLNTWIDEIPPTEATSHRFGNKAFREWVERVESRAQDLLTPLLPSGSNTSETGPLIELIPYFIGSFGHKVRLDYGSGHELSFAGFLCCLDILDIIQPTDYTRLVLKVFVEYLELVRRLQMVYSLEPAGSHGVWGLDDHQFLPYYFGAGQLVDHPHLKPKCITSREIVDHFANDNLYLRCIQHINTVKRGPFHEHSPLLYDISGVPNWQKVNSGMLKMFVNEVLYKVPIVQHFVFGNLLPFIRCPDLVME